MVVTGPVLVVTNMIIVATMVVITLAAPLSFMLLALPVGTTVVMIFGPVITVQNRNHWDDHRLPTRPVKEQLLQPADNCPVQGPLVDHLVILEGIQDCPENLVVGGLNQLL